VSIHTQETLLRDLAALGVAAGDVLFIHSSFKSLGVVDGGAATVIAALEGAVGEDGLILMPSFNLVASERRAETWDVRTTPSTVGWLTEFFRRMPGTYRSDHYSHSVAARGKNAEAFVADHLSKEGFKSPWDKEPWGATYGARSPMVRAYRADGKLLMLGVDYNSSTYMHLVEVMHSNRRRETDANARYFGIDRPQLGEHWDSLSNQRRGRVGDADGRLFGIREFVDTLLETVTENPQRFFKNYL
jgi:aminoglycoside 3-N-acetyltransferase